jgi:hypothetical protein
MFLHVHQNLNHMGCSDAIHGWMTGQMDGWRQMCVYLTIHITKLQLQTTFPKPLYIPHSACIHQDPGR